MFQCLKILLPVLKVTSLLLKASSSRASSFVDSTCKMRNENVSKSVGIWQYDVAVAVALHKLIPAAYAPRHILL